MKRKHAYSERELAILKLDTRINTDLVNVIGLISDRVLKIHKPKTLRELKQVIAETLEEMIENEEMTAPLDAEIVYLNDKMKNN